MKVFVRSKFLCMWLATALVCDSIAPISSQAQTSAISFVQQASLSSSVSTSLLKGVKIFPDDPLRLDFIVDAAGAASDDPKEPSGDAGFPQNEYLKLVKYFLASLAVPEGDLWVNLNPKEPDRIIPATLGRTDMGRELLAQDYLLKQLASSLLSPEGESGKKFWDEIYQKMYEATGSTDVPVDMLNRVWIVPAKATVYNAGDAAYVTEAKLKVMMEEEYLVKNSPQPPLSERGGARSAGELEVDVKDLIRQTILPIIEREVNEGASFAPLRQIFYSLILAKWFKKNLRDTLLGHEYAEHNKIQGIDIPDGFGQRIYDQYLQAFQNGAFQYLKESYDPATQQVVPRQYFSGGFSGAIADKDFAQLQAQDLLPKTDQGLNTLTVRLDAAMNNAMLEQNPNSSLAGFETITAFREKFIDDAQRCHELLKNRLELVDPDMIQAGEEPENRTKIDQIKEEFRRTGFLLPSWVVREEGYQDAILDGNHRLIAARELKAEGYLKYIPIIWVTWDEFELDAWHYEVSINSHQAAETQALIEQYGFEAIGSPSQSSDFLDRMTLTFNDVLYALPGDHHSADGKYEEYEVMGKFLKNLAKFGVKVDGTIIKREKLSQLREPGNRFNLLSEGSLTVYMQSFSKNDLKEFFRRNRMLPPKGFRTMMNISLPPLPMNIGVKTLSDYSADWKSDNDLPRKLREQFLKELDLFEFKNFWSVENIAQSPDYTIWAQVLPVPPNGFEGSASQFKMFSVSSMKERFDSHKISQALSKANQNKLRRIQEVIHGNFQSSVGGGLVTRAGQLSMNTYDPNTHQVVLTTSFVGGESPGVNVTFYGGQDEFYRSHILNRIIQSLGEHFSYQKIGTKNSYHFPVEGISEKEDFYLGQMDGFGYGAGYSNDEQDPLFISWMRLFNERINHNNEYQFEHSTGFDGTNYNINKKDGTVAADFFYQKDSFSLNFNEGVVSFDDVKSALESDLNLNFNWVKEQNAEGRNVYRFMVWPADMKKEIFSPLTDVDIQSLVGVLENMATRYHQGGGFDSEVIQETGERIWHDGQSILMKMQQKDGHVEIIINDKDKSRLKTLLIKHEEWSFEIRPSSEQYLNICFVVGKGHFQGAIDKTTGNQFVEVDWPDMVAPIEYDEEGRMVLIGNAAMMANPLKDLLVPLLSFLKIYRSSPQEIHPELGISLSSIRYSPQETQRLHRMTFDRLNDMVMSSSVMKMMFKNFFKQMFKVVGEEDRDRRYRMLKQGVLRSLTPYIGEDFQRVLRLSHPNDTMSFKDLDIHFYFKATDDGRLILSMLARDVWFPKDAPDKNPLRTAKKFSSDFQSGNYVSKNTREGVVFQWVFSKKVWTDKVLKANLNFAMLGQRKDSDDFINYLRSLDFTETQIQQITGKKALESDKRGYLDFLRSKGILNNTQIAKIFQRRGKLADNQILVEDLMRFSLFNGSQISYIMRSKHSSGVIKGLIRFLVRQKIFTPDHMAKIIRAGRPFGEKVRLIKLLMSYHLNGTDVMEIVTADYSSEDILQQCKRLKESGVLTDFRHLNISIRDYFTDKRYWDEKFLKSSDADVVKARTKKDSQKLLRRSIDYLLLEKKVSWEEARDWLLIQDYTEEEIALYQEAWRKRDAQVSAAMMTDQAKVRDYFENGSKHQLQLSLAARSRAEELKIVLPDDPQLKEKFEAYVQDSFLKDYPNLVKLFNESESLYHRRLKAELINHPYWRPVFLAAYKEGGHGEFIPHSSFDELKDYGGESFVDQFLSFSVGSLTPMEETRQYLVAAEKRAEKYFDEKNQGASQQDLIDQSLKLVIGINDDWPVGDGVNGRRTPIHGRRVFFPVFEDGSWLSLKGCGSYQDYDGAPYGMAYHRGLQVGSVLKNSIDQKFSFSVDSLGMYPISHVWGADQRWKDIAEEHSEEKDHMVIVVEKVNHPDRLTLVPMILENYGSLNRAAWDLSVVLSNKGQIDKDSVLDQESLLRFLDLSMARNVAQHINAGLFRDNFHDQDVGLDGQMADSTDLVNVEDQFWWNAEAWFRKLGEFSDLARQAWVEGHSSNALDGFIHSMRKLLLVYQFVAHLDEKSRLKIRKYYETPYNQMAAESFIEWKIAYAFIRAYDQPEFGQMREYLERYLQSDMASDYWKGWSGEYKSFYDLFDAFSESYFESNGQVILKDDWGAAFSQQVLKPFFEKTKVLANSAMMADRVGVVMGVDGRMRHAGREIDPILTRSMTGLDVDMPFSQFWKEFLDYLNDSKSFESLLVDVRDDPIISQHIPTAYQILRNSGSQNIIRVLKSGIGLLFGSASYLRGTPLSDTVEDMDFMIFFEGSDVELGRPLDALVAKYMQKVLKKTGPFTILMYPVTGLLNVLWMGYHPTDQVVFGLERLNTVLAGISSRQLGVFWVDQYRWTLAEIDGFLQKQNLSLKHYKRLYWLAMMKGESQATLDALSGEYRNLSAAFRSALQSELQISENQMIRDQGRKFQEILESYKPYLRNEEKMSELLQALTNKYIHSDAAMMAEHPWKDDPEKEYLGSVVYTQKTIEYLLGINPEKKLELKDRVVQAVVSNFGENTAVILERLYAWVGKSMPSGPNRQHITLASSLEKSLGHGIENAIDSYLQRRDEDPDYREELVLHFYLKPDGETFRIWFVANGYGLEGAEDSGKKEALGSRRLGGYGEGNLLAYKQSAKFGGTSELVQDRMEIIGDERGSVNQLMIDKALFLRHYDNAMMAEHPWKDDLSKTYLGAKIYSEKELRDLFRINVQRHADDEPRFFTTHIWLYDSYAELFQKVNDAIDQWAGLKDSHKKKWQYAEYVLNLKQILVHAVDNIIDSYQQRRMDESYLEPLTLHFYIQQDKNNFVFYVVANGFGLDGAEKSEDKKIWGPAERLGRESLGRRFIRDFTKDLGAEYDLQDRMDVIGDERGSVNKFTINRRLFLDNYNSAMMAKKSSFEFAVVLRDGSTVFIWDINVAHKNGKTTVIMSPPSNIVSINSLNSFEAPNNVFELSFGFRTWNELDPQKMFFEKLKGAVDNPKIFWDYFKGKEEQSYIGLSQIFKSLSDEDESLPPNFSPVDNAMLATLELLVERVSQKSKTGGIDLNGFEVETKGSRTLPAGQADAAQLSGTIAFGLKPVIKSIGPADLHSFLNIVPSR